MKRGGWIVYKGMRIDCCMKSRGCYKVRHHDMNSYLLMDFETVADAKRFVDEVMKKRAA